MLNAMAIALSGVGYSSIVLALNGFFDVAVSAVELFAADARTQGR